MRATTTLAYAVHQDRDRGRCYLTVTDPSLGPIVPEVLTAPDPAPVPSPTSIIDEVTVQHAAACLRDTTLGADVARFNALVVLQVGVRMARCAP